MGDAHSGNIICSNNVEEYIYIDYEFAGFHSPYLDIAKSLYNDTSFNLLYCDKLPLNNLPVSAEISNHKLVINHHYQPDKISRYIFHTKFVGILLQYQNYCQNNGLPQDEDWKTTLGSALFCCGLLTRNLAEFSQDNLLLNLANSVESTDIDHITQLMSQNL